MNAREIKKEDKVTNKKKGIEGTGCSAFRHFTSDRAQLSVKSVCSTQAFQTRSSRYVI